MKYKFTLYTYLLLLFYFVICLLSGQVLQIFVGIRIFFVFLIFGIWVISFFFIFIKEFWKSVGYEIRFFKLKKVVKI